MVFMVCNLQQQSQAPTIAPPMTHSRDEAQRASADKVERGGGGRKDKMGDGAPEAHWGVASKPVNRMSPT